MCIYSCVYTLPQLIYRPRAFCALLWLISQRPRDHCDNPNMTSTNPNLDPEYGSEAHPAHLPR